MIDNKKREKILAIMVAAIILIITIYSLVIDHWQEFYRSWLEVKFRI